MLFEAIRVILRLVKKPAPHVIDCHNAIVLRQILHKVPPGETPGGIAVNHQQDFALAFVEVVVTQPVEIEEMGFKRIFTFKSRPRCRRGCPLSGRIQHRRLHKTHRLFYPICDTVWRWF